MGLLFKKKRSAISPSPKDMVKAPSSLPPGLSLIVPPIRNRKRQVLGAGMQSVLYLAVAVAFLYFSLLHPWLVPYIYVGGAAPLIIYRFINYYNKLWHHFLWDLCYFANSLLILFICIPSVFNHDIVFLTLFGLCNGVVILGAVLFRNSILFYDVHKFTSVYIHVIPPLVTYLIKWVLRDENYKTCSDSDCWYPRKMYGLFAPTMVFFLCHQLIYNLWVNCIPHKKLKNCQNYNSSYMYFRKSW